MASRSGTANGANRDVECAYESGRRAIRYGAGLVCGAVRSGTACDTVWIGTACVLTDRDDERYGADLDGVCVNGYESTICERNARWYGTN